MELLAQDQFWLLVAAIAAVAFMLGRASAGGGSGEDRAARRLREREAAEGVYSALSPSHQAEIDRLIMDGKTIEAIKQLREATGLGLKESKDAVDARRQALKGG